MLSTSYGKTSLQCFDARDWVTRRPLNLQKNLAPAIPKGFSLGDLQGT